jgi:hypothetical protein
MEGLAPFATVHNRPAPAASVFMEGRRERECESVRETESEWVREIGHTSPEWVVHPSEELLHSHRRWDYRITHDQTPNTWGSKIFNTLNAIRNKVSGIWTQQMVVEGEKKRERKKTGHMITPPESDFSLFTHTHTWLSGEKMPIRRSGSSKRRRGRRRRKRAFIRMRSSTRRDARVGRTPINPCRNHRRAVMERKTKEGLITNTHTHTHTT